jgi:hypothetical protein
MIDIQDGKPVGMRIRVYLRDSQPKQAIIWSGTFDEAGKLTSGGPENEKGIRNNVALGLEIFRRLCSHGQPTNEAATMIAENRRKIGWPWPEMQLDYTSANLRIRPSRWPRQNVRDRTDDSLSCRS